jgi:beta-lactamase class A
MTFSLTRRSFAALALNAALAGGLPARGRAAPTHRALAQAQAAIAALEAQSRGRLGVVVVETSSGRRISFRARERFAMCSTHKFLTAAAVLTLADRGKIHLDQRVPYGRADLLDYAPITRKQVGAGFMTIEALCAAAIEWSDNTAANLLLKLIGGPAGWTRYARSIGDAVSRLDRFEPALNSAVPGDPRDTTTPEAMARDLAAVLLDDALSHASRERLQNWMLDSAVTATLLKADLPSTWRVADKSGSGENGARNDIGLLLPLKGAPILAAVYSAQPTQPSAARDKLIAEVGRIIVDVFG